MDKTELINTLAFDKGLSRAESKEIVEKVFVYRQLHAVIIQ